MRAALITLAAFALAACGQSSAPSASEPAVETEAEPPAAFVGQYTAMSNTATAITGDMDLAPDVLSFANGFRIEGRRLDAMLTADTDLSAGGGTARDASGNTNIATMELRRVDRVLVAADARDPQLCGADAAASYVIVAHALDTISVLVFSGADAPGPNAHDSQLCGVYNYAVAG